MAGTRSSSRIAAQSSSPSSQNNSSPKPAAGTKRKSDTASSSKSKRGKKGAEKEQKTIEETLSTSALPTAQDSLVANPRIRDEPKSEPTANDQPVTENGAAETTANKAKEAQDNAEADNVDESAKEHSDVASVKPNGDVNGTKASDDTPKMDGTGAIEPKDEAMTDAAQHDNKEPDAPVLRHDESAVVAGAREEETPSSILEKGVIYFFFRARVNVQEPQDTNDIARSYMVLRPIPHGAKIAEGPIGDDGNCRLLALPKKVLPLSGKDRFMVFVEKAKTSFNELKDNFISASDYATKTAGTSHTPAATPVGEGIYAITTTGRESHLAYILTIPSELDEVQKDIGLRERGSFVTSIKNPEQKGPANTSLLHGPDYPQE